MDVKVSRDHITGILQKAGNITPARAAMASLRAIWLQAEGATLTCISTDASVEYVGSCAATVATSGIVGVDGKNLVELVCKLPAGEIHLRLDDASGNLLVEQGRRKYKLPTVGAEWFAQPRPFPEQPVLVAGDVIQEILERVRFCISTEVASEAIGCLMLRRAGQSIEAVGLNGSNMAMLSVHNADLCAMIPEAGMLIAEKHLNFIKKTLPNDEVEVATCGKFLHFRHGQGAESFSVPLSTYVMPSLDLVIERATKQSVPVLHVQRTDLEEALARTAIFNTVTDRAVKFLIEPTHMTITPNGTEAGEASEVIDATYEGSNVTISFPSLKLREILGHFASQTVHMRMHEPESPCCITGDDDPDYMTIIMPMKVVTTVYYSENEV